MKTLLSSLRAQDKTSQALSTKPTKSSHVLSVEECGTEDHPYITSDATYQMKAGEFICINVSDKFFISLGDSLTIEGTGHDGKEIAAVQNAYAGTTGLYKVTATKDTSVNVYIPTDERFYSFLLAEKEPDYSYQDGDYYIVRKSDPRYVLSFRKRRGLTVSYDFDVNLHDKNVSLEYKTETLISFNPNNHSVIYQYYAKKIGLFTIPEGRTKTEDDYEQAQGEWVYTAPNDKNATIKDNANWDDLEGYHRFKVTCTIDSAEVPPFFPDTDVKLLPNTIYSDQTEAYSFLAGGKLSAGVVAAIVVGCLVAVIIIISIICCCCCKGCSCCHCCRCCSSE